MSGFAYLIFVVGVLLAWAFGALGAYYYFRARHREAITDLDALGRELDEREEELHRLQYQFKKANPDGPSSGQLAELQKAREELEQKRNDYNILKQDYDLELGILKQELEQLRSEESDVEHTRRRIARKTSELKEREARLVEKETDVDKRSKRLDADISARRKHLDEEFSARIKRLEEGLHKRDEALRERFSALDEERQALEEERRALRKKQEQLDKELLELPVHRFTSPQEALLIKRLRQQMKLQRDELEQLHLAVHRARAKHETPLKSSTGRPDAAAEKTRKHADQPIPPRVAGISNDPKETTNDANTPAGPDQNDSLPTYSTLSFYVQHPEKSDSHRKLQESASRTVYDDDAGLEDGTAADGGVEDGSVEDGGVEHGSVADGNVEDAGRLFDDADGLGESDEIARPRLNDAAANPDPVADAGSPPAFENLGGADEAFAIAPESIGRNSGKHDDLTSLPGVNPQLQDRLYQLGITSFDQIARWSSSEVRGVSEKLEIDRKIIQDHWIINAQSHLFSREGD